MNPYNYYFTSFIFEKVNDPSVWVYDLETYPNIFTATFYNVASGEVRVYEISDRLNHTPSLLEFLEYCSINGQVFVGYNNLTFDYPILHMIMKLGELCRLEDIWEKSQQLINVAWVDRFSVMIYDPLIKQIDLLKVMHFDNVSRATSLKMLECRMNMQSVKELPFPPGTMLTHEQMDTLITYNWHDVFATLWFFSKIQKEIKLRADLSIKYAIDFTNFSDSKIGSKIFEQALNQASVQCDKNIQTKRDFIKLSDCIAPYIQFKNPEFNKIKEYFESQTITETKGVFSDLNCEVDGLTYVFAVGGLHASVSNESYHSDEDMIIQDSDVKSYYPNLSIKNNYRPEHLGIEFCNVYKNLYEQRQTYDKSTAENAALKIALNGTYGNSNNKYSPFYDPKFTMTITVTGQLSLAMLAENLILVPGLKIISVNTDGICYIFPRKHAFNVQNICNWWEQITNGLELEHVEYKAIHQRDVNNYIAVTVDGKIKRKGCYCYGEDLVWNKDHSMQVVAKSAEKWLTKGRTDKELIINHPQLLDFIIHLKVPKNTILIQGDTVLPNVIRYVITNDGIPLSKLMPPKGIEGQFKRANKLTDEFFDSVMSEIGYGVWDERIHTKNKSVYAERRSDINKGYKATLVTDLSEFANLDINYAFYINETNKITEKFFN